MDDKVGNLSTVEAPDFEKTKWDDERRLRTRELEGAL